MATWRLGLDVGTASVGAVAIKLDESGRETGVAWHHVRIFSEPNEKGQAGLTPKKAARRKARQQRRQIERRARRLRRIAHLAPLIGIDPTTVPPDGRCGQELPTLRAQAARGRIELPDLLRVLLRLAKRRGYAGTFVAAEADDDTGLVQAGSEKLEEAMREMARARGLPAVTLGEYLALRRSAGLPTRLKPNREDVPNLYALRKMVEGEFDQIWSTQEQFHPQLRASYSGRAVREFFREAIFFQRPLKSPAPSVGLCPLEKHLPRAPRAQMAAQQFRIEKTLADLRWGTGGIAQSLTHEQRSAIRDVLSDPSMLTKKGEVSFSKVYKVLKKRGCPGPEGRSLNIERSSRDELRGNTTLKAFADLGLLDGWQALSDRHQISVINLLADLGSPEQLDSDDWHRRFRKASARPGDKDALREFAPEVVAFIDHLRRHPNYGRLNPMGFEGGRMAYSVKALKSLTTWLQEPSWREQPGPEPRIDEEAAVRECYPWSGVVSVTGELPPAPKTGNDTVDVALTQVEWTVRQALRAMGTPPAEVIVEFGREVGLSPAKRNEWEKISDKNRRSRNAARVEIEEAGARPTATNIRRFLLSQEQETHCPYCGQQLSLGDVLNGSSTHVDHIIPKSLTQVGKKRSEIVIAHAACNNLKGDRTPWQAFGHDEQRWRAVEQRAEALRRKKQFRKAKLLLLKDFEQEVLTDQSITEFVDRQLHQTSWVARETSTWLRRLCSNVFAARGEFTALLRRSWKLDTVIPEVRLRSGLTVLDADGQEVTQSDFEQNRAQWEGHGRPPARMLEKRLDHRHHLIDALVIALTSRSLYQKLASNYRQQLEQVKAGLARRHEWQVAPPVAAVREVGLELVANAQLTRKPDRFPAGQLFQDTAYAVLGHGPSAVLTVRKPIASLHQESSVEATRKEIGKVASPTVRLLVLDEFNRRVAEGRSPKEALSQPILHPQYGTSIRHVRVIRTDVSAEKAKEIVFTSRRGQHIKRLVPDGNAYLEVAQHGEVMRTRVVSLAEAGARDRVAPEGVSRFYKGDTVIDSKDKSVLIVRQIRDEHGGQLILTPIFEARPVRQLTANDGRRKVGGAGLRRLSTSDVFQSCSSAGGQPISGD